MCRKHVGRGIQDHDESPNLFREGEREKKQRALIAKQPGTIRITSPRVPNLSKKRKTNGQKRSVVRSDVQASNGEKTKPHRKKVTAKNRKKRNEKMCRGWSPRDFNSEKTGEEALVKIPELNKNKAVRKKKPGEPAKMRKPKSW